MHGIPYSSLVVLDSGPWIFSGRSIAMQDRLQAHPSKLHGMLDLVALPSRNLAAIAWVLVYY